MRRLGKNRACRAVCRIWFQASAAAATNRNTKTARPHASSKPRLDTVDAKTESDYPVIASADVGGSLRIWSRWPLPQQLADFSLQHSCTALAFLWPMLLLGCFSDGSLRLFDSKAFSMIGRLQLAAPQDPPVAIACLGGEGAPYLKL